MVLYFAKHVIWNHPPTAHGNNFREMGDDGFLRNDIAFVESVPLFFSPTHARELVLPVRALPAQ